MACNELRTVPCSCCVVSGGADSGGAVSGGVVSGGAVSAGAVSAGVVRWCCQQAVTLLTMTMSTVCQGARVVKLTGCLTNKLHTACWTLLNIQQATNQQYLIGLQWSQEKGQ